MTDHPNTQSGPIPAAAVIVSPTGEPRISPILVTDFYRKETK